MKLYANAAVGVVLSLLAASEAKAKDAWACGYADISTPGNTKRSGVFEVQKNNLVETRAAKGSGKPTTFTYGISENNALFLVATHSAFSLNGGPTDSPDSSIVVIDKEKGGIWVFDVSTTHPMGTPPIGKCVKQ